MQPRLPTKIMIGRSRADAFSSTERAAVTASGRANSGPASRNAWRRLDLQAPQHAEEIMRVLERAPGVAQRRHVDLGIGQAGASAAGSASRAMDGDWSSARKRSISAVKAHVVGFGRSVDLVHRDAGGVEDLQAAAVALRGPLGHGESVLPRRQEDPQIDVGPQHQAHDAGDGHVLVAAVALVHARLVAGQRHDAPDLRQRLEQLRPVAPQPDRGVAASRRHQCGFGGAECTGGVADAHLRILGAKLAPPSGKAGRALGALHRGRQHGPCSFQRMAKRTGTSTHAVMRRPLTLAGSNAQPRTARRAAASSSA